MPPILLIHGACSQPAHLDAWRDFFVAAGHACVLLRLPRHSAGEFAALRRLRMLDYLAAALEAHGRLAEPPVVVGHSMGGLIAQMLAARRPCAAIVLVAAVPPGYLPATPWAAPWFVVVAPQVLAGLPFRPYRPALRQLTLHHLGRPEQDAVLPGFVAESGRAYREMLLGLARVPVKAVTCPVLVVHGDRDRLVPLWSARRLARRHGAEMQVVIGHGHWLVAPSLVPAVAGPVRDWIARLSPVAGRPSQPRTGDV